MAVDFRHTHVPFDTSAGIPQKSSRTVNFGKTVNRADAAIKGFRIQYTQGDNEFAFQRIAVQNVVIANQTVTFEVLFELRDETGWGHAYEGAVEVLVIADVA